MDDKLSRALRALPREHAGSGFTAGVMRRIEAPRRPAATRWPLLAAAAVLLVLVGFGAREWWHLHQRQQVTTRLAALEEERRELVAELAALRRLASQARPVVYLGGNSELDLVLDVARLQRSAASTRLPGRENVLRQHPAAAMPQPLTAAEPGRREPLRRTIY